MTLTGFVGGTGLITKMPLTFQGSKSETLEKGFRYGWMELMEMEILKEFFFVVLFCVFFKALDLEDSR